MARRILPLAVVVGLALGGASAASLAAASTRSAAKSVPGAWHFVSAPQLLPPRLQAVSRKPGAISRGYFLTGDAPNLAHLGPYYGKPSLLLLDSSMRPVWVAEVGNGENFNLQQQTYRGQPVLMWWSGGLSVSGTGTFAGNSVTVVNEHYQKIATLRAASPWLLDAHDDWIEGSHIWVVVARYLHNQDLTRYGGSSNESIYDCGVQEYDLRTGKLLYTWDALNPGGKPHVPPSQSYVRPPPPSKSGPGGFWDPYHVNSLQVLPHHRLLISMRNTWGVYLIDERTGRIVWTLGGKASSFTQDRHARFAWQHDARLRTHGGTIELTLFNDNCCQEKSNAGRGQAQGMILKLDLRRHSSTLVAAYRHSPPLVESGFGSLELLGEGNVLIDWSDYISEYSRSGKQLLDVRWPGIDRSYRARYTDTWVGVPYYPPAGAVREAHGHTVVYASWNGATQVVHWAVLAGGTKQTLSRVATASRNGFETRLALDRSYHVYRVQALDAAGHVLRTSPAFSG